MDLETAPTDAPGRRSLRARRPWLIVGLALAAVGWGANQFAPLMLLYRTEFGISAVAVQAGYALYAAGLIPGLLLAGPLSDRYGRRRLLLPALLTSFLASVLLVTGGIELAGMITGRLVSGVASGLAFGSGTAWLTELSAPRSGGRPHPGPRRATVAMTTGFAGGPLAAGVLAQWAPAPAFSAYLPHLALTIVAAWLLRGLPETRVPNRRGTPGRSPRLSPANARRFRGVVVPLAPWVFGASSIALAYLPGYAPDRLGQHALMFGAVTTSLTMLAGIVVQPLARRIDQPGRPILLVTALGVVAGGLILGATATELSSPWLVGCASLVLGAGYGCCLVCGLLETQRLAGPDNLGRLTATYQAIAYLGFASPYLLALLDVRFPAGWLLLAAAGCALLTLARTTCGAVANRPDHRPLPDAADGSAPTPTAQPRR